MQGFKAPMLVNLFVVLIAIASPPINGLDSRKLDENSVPGSEKCTPCTQYPPPSPSPPPPSPPPPSPPPPPASPPPSPKNPPSQYCPPPPSPPSFLYITGPPGNLYPVDENFNGATKKNLVMGLPFLVGFGLLLGLVAF